MLSKRPSSNNRIDKFTRSFKGKLSSLFQSSRPPTLSSMDADSGSDNHMTTTDTGTSNLPLKMLPATGVASTEAGTVSPPVSVPISAPMSQQVGSVSDPGPNAPPTHMSTNTHSPMSLFQGAHNVYLHQPKFNMANSSRSQILKALSEKLLPRAQFAEYDAASLRNACTEHTRQAILYTLQIWASDNTTTMVYWLNGMAGTGKTTISYAFSKFLRERGSLGGTFFSSRQRVDTSDIHCIIPTISLQLAKYLPFLSQHILDVVEANPDCSSWGIRDQFLNFIVKPLTDAYRDTREVVDVPVIVLDALDECSDQSLVAELLFMISEHSKSLPAKFFITSRPGIMLQHPWDHSNFLLHEIEKEIYQADIELYIKACLLEGQIKHNRHDWPSQAELDMLVNMTGSSFIYAATVCRYITGRGSVGMPERLSYVVNSALETISGINHPLDILYERILDAVYDPTSIWKASDIDMNTLGLFFLHSIP
ncbi:hypothetical protein BYT27DRAFT_7243235 [Phlegmacium glaucopus]|nr:hypothetical protein BYT27DRAFT_7243235 [Phlegmacium glaucopus]